MLELWRALPSIGTLTFVVIVRRNPCPTVDQEAYIEDAAGNKYDASGDDAAERPTRNHVRGCS